MDLFGWLKGNRNDEKDNNSCNTTQSVAKSSSVEKELTQLQETLAAQDRQIQEIHDAEDLYKNDIKGLICFWEKIWENGGLLFNGSKWTFRLPDLYIKQKKYDDALRILEMIRNPQYKDKKESYVKKVMGLKEKSGKISKT